MFIFIDLDDTILDFKKAEGVALRRMLLSFNVEATDENVSLYSQINDKMWKRLERKEATREEILVLRFKEFFEAVNVNADAFDANERYKEFLSQGHFFMPEAEELLEVLYKKHRLFIVSNGTTFVQNGRIKSANIKRYFEDIFLSQDVGFDKPDARFFEACFNTISGFNRREAVILGDSLSSDILGGINANISTCWYNPQSKPSGDIKPNYEIHSLLEFLEII